MSAAGIAENRYAGSSAPHRTEPCMKDVTPSFSCLPSLSEGASWQRIVPARTFLEECHTETKVRPSDFG
jgi:hypothetical protein